MTSKTVQSEQKQGPIFSHRFDSTQAHDISEVINAVGLMTERAKGILYMLFAHEGSDSRYSDKIVHSAIDAAIAEIDDIDSVLNAHFAAIKKAERSAK
jgi:hypothetical protein